MNFFKVLYSLLFISLSFIHSVNTASYLDNEKKYQEYDSTYSNQAFHIRDINVHGGFINGLDCSMVSRIEECGGKFYDFDNKPKEFFSLIKENGINLARFRLWYDWNSDSGVKGGGMCDKERVLGMAVRAKKVGLKFLLDFHYSDNWADPGKQSCPSAWRGLSFEKATDTLFKYTQETMSYFVSHGAQPDYVQIGNEINNGFMFPYGQINWSSDQTKKETIDKVATLITQATKAVKMVSGTTKIIIHVGDYALKTWHDDKTGKDVPTGLWFFQQLKMRNVYFDIAAVSFYLFYHHKSYDDYLDMNKITDCINQFADTLGKPFLIMEYSTAFTLKSHQFADNQFGSEQSKCIEKEYPTTFQGQVNFMLDMAERVSWAKNGRGLGIVYWGGDWIPVQGAGWAGPSTKASWSNQALFTYDGLASPALAAMKIIGKYGEENTNLKKEYQ